MRRILYTREKSFAGKAAHMRRIEALAAMAACACLCAALSGCAVKEPAAQEEADPAPQAAVQPTPDFKESASGDPRLREGKEEVTVLVLNASSAEGAARKAAEKIEALGFEHVTTGNASYYQTGNRVSYHHEEHRAEVDEARRCSTRFRPTIPIATKMRRAAAGAWTTTFSSWWADRQLRTTRSTVLREEDRRRKASLLSPCGRAAGAEGLRGFAGFQSPF